MDPSQPGHPGHPPTHPSQQQMSQQGPPPPPPQSAYYQPVQHGGPPPPPQHGPHPMAPQSPYMHYPQPHPQYYPHHPQHPQMQPSPHSHPPPPPHSHPHPQQHMMQHHPAQQMPHHPQHPTYYQQTQPSPHPQHVTHGPPPQYYPHHPQHPQMQPPHPGHPGHPGHPSGHPGQQMSQQGPPQSAYYQPVQHGPPPPPPQNGPHPMAQNPYMHYAQPHPQYYPHHPQHPQMQPPPHSHPPQPHPHAQPHMMQHHPAQQMPHAPHHPSYYQPAQPPPPPPHVTHPVQPPPVPQHPTGPPPPPQQVPPPQHQAVVGPPPPHQQLPPPASPHHPPSRTQTPQHPPASQTPTRVVQPLSSTPSSPSIIPKSEKKEITFPKNSVEATKPVVTKKRKFTSKDVTDIEVWRLLMCLKSGLLAESSWAIDVLSILLNDDSTSMYFGLQHMPGLLEAVLEHFKCYLNEIYKDMAIKDTTLKPELSKPVSYSHWQEGNGEDTSHIQVYYEPHSFIESSRRCICISTILRNLSFVPGNDVEMSKHAGLLLILGRILMYKPDDIIYNEFDSTPNEWQLLGSLREDTLVIISNISSSLDLTPYNDKINLSLLKGLLHWACSSTSYALDPFPSPSISVSPQRLALESLAKLSIIEGNVDLILATPPWTRIEKLFQVLANLLNANEEQTVREFSLVLLSNLTAADSGIARKVALTGAAIPRLVSFLESSISDPDNFATTPDMLRRAALTLKCLSQLVDNHSLFSQYQQRLLNLVMLQKLDQEVGPIIADVIFEISLSY